MAPDEDAENAAKMRVVAVVIIVTMIVWLGVQWLGGKLGLSFAFAFAFDLAALGAFFWALVMTYQIWRGRQDK